MEKPIKGYEGLYVISEKGVIRNCRSNAVLKGNINSFGYRVVSLVRNGKKKDFKLHRLLAIAFISNPYNYECVNHIDGNKENNSLDNLEWCTKNYNNRHAREQLSLDYVERAIVQSTLSGKVVAVWRNANIAATVLNGSSVCILACCRKTAASAYNYQWSYAETTFSDVLKNEQRLLITQEIERLSHELEQLSG